MAKKRAMTGAERKRKHRAATDTKQINITLPNLAVAELDRQAKKANQTRSELIATLITQIAKPQPKPTIASTKKKPIKSKKKIAPQPTLDVIGLARPGTFKDNPSAVIVRAEVKDMPTMDMATGQQGVKWRDLPTRSMAVWEAQKHIEAFKQSHTEATIKQRYMVDDKTIMEITATYSDDRTDHRGVYQARNR